MNKLSVLLIISFFTSILSYSQIDEKFVDDKYLEDQLYISVTYNILKDQPTDFNQNGLSGGISLGYFKDIPINKRRNIGFALGLGYSYNAYIQNLKVSTANNITSFETIPNIDFSSNRLTTHSIEAPIELRWRRSTATNNDFLRVYAGIKFDYIFANNSKFVSETETIETHNFDYINKLQYGLTLSLGYSNYNIRIYYGLNSLLDKATVNAENINLRQVNIGFIFYIL